MMKIEKGNDLYVQMKMVQLRIELKCRDLNKCTEELNELSVLENKRWVAVEFEVKELDEILRSGLSNEDLIQALESHTENLRGSL